MNQECPVCGAGLPPDVASEEPDLRDAFAMAALSANDWSQVNFDKFSASGFASFAYQIADAMLAERRKKK